MAQTVFRITPPGPFPPASAPRRGRLRAPIACQYCRGRKVRCDLNKRGSQCTNCELDNIHCRVANTRRRKSDAVPTAKSNLDSFSHALNIGPDPDSIHVATVNVGTVGDIKSSKGIRHDPQRHSPRNESSIEETSLAASVGKPMEALPEPETHNSQTASVGLTAMGADIVEDGLFLETPEPIDASPQFCSTPSHLPQFPSFIRPIHETLSTAAINYLTCEGAFWLPEGQLRQALVDACFEFVAPFMPSLDRSEILGHTDVSLDSAPCQKSIGILLFQAILFAGSSFVDVVLLESADLPSRREARRAFYRRARLLYDFDVNGSHVEVLHALLLMSFWYEDPDDSKDAGYWLGAQVFHAQQFGLQEKALSVQPYRSFYRRLWWSAYIRDALISLGLRLHPKLGAPIPMLTLDDFIPDGQQEDSLPSDGYDRGTLCVRMAELCLLINQIMSDDDLSQGHTEQVDLQLRTWLRHCTLSLQPTNDPPKGITVGRLLLNMTYHTVVSTLHLPHISQGPDSPRTGAMNPVSERNYHKVQAAAYQVSVLANIMLRKGLVGFVPTQGITCVLPAASILLLNLKSPSRRSDHHSADGLRACMCFLERLGERYAASESVLNNLKAAVEKANVSLESREGQQSCRSPSFARELSLELRHDTLRDDLPTDLSNDFDLDGGFQGGDAGIPLFEETLGLEDGALYDLQKEPFFHQMSSFLTLESDFFDQFATSTPDDDRMLGGIELAS
ncbi:hypothetical protein ACJZ2D_009279 [Fusarium nematophilum]